MKTVQTFEQSVEATQSLLINETNCVCVCGLELMVLIEESSSRE